jgi:hypothetical protein
MKPVLSALQHRIHSDQPYTFLYEVQRIAAAGRRIENLRIENPADSLAFVENAWIVP